MSTTTTDRFNGLNGGIAFKAPCHLATTANITLSAVQTVDGVATVVGDRVLVKDQSVASENGIYDVSTSAWQRSADFDGNGDIVTGTMVRVNFGSANANTFWRVSSVGENTVGASPIDFSASNVQQSAVSSFMAPILLSAGESELKTAVNAEADVDFLGYSDVRGKFFGDFVGVVGGGTINLSALGSAKLNITGSGAIISSLGGSVAGHPIYFVRFSGINTLVNGAGLVLPTGGDIVTADGDTAIVIDEGFSVFRVYAYQRADGTAVARQDTQNIISTPLTTAVSFANQAGSIFTGNIPGLEATITPSAASKRVRVTLTICVGANVTSPNSILIKLKRDAADIGVSANGNSGAVFMTSTLQASTVTITYIDSPASDSAITYGAEIAHQGGGAVSIYVNRRHSDTTVMGISTITVEEIN